MKKKGAESKKHEVFPNAPIVEALMDIQVQLDIETGMDALKNTFDSIKDRYNKKEEQHFFSSGVGVGEDALPVMVSPKTGLRGYIFRSEKEGKVVQSRIDGWTFSKLKPYENWTSFLEEGRSLWKTYSEVARPISIDRIALRYINRIEVPLPFDDFGDYILTNPEIAPGIPQGIANFFMRIEIPNLEIQSTAIITQTMDIPTETNRLPLIFDIDVFRKHEYVDHTDEMWEDFGKLHHFKNDIFFGSVTEKCKDLFR